MQPSGKCMSRLIDRGAVLRLAIGRGFLTLAINAIGLVRYIRHRVLPAVIQHAVWLYFRFTFSNRDVEEMLARPGVDAQSVTCNPHCSR